MNVLILIKNGALDHSVFNFATSLFAMDNTTFHLLHVVTTNGEIPTQPNGQILDVCTEFDLSEYIAEAKQQQTYLDEFQHELVTDRNAFIGNRSAILKDYIKTHDIDIVVGGAHKTSLAEDLFVTTFAATVIENTEIPFVTIKCNRDNFDAKRIALVGDFIHVETENLESLKRISAFHNSEIVLTKILSHQDQQSVEDIERVMRDYATHNNLNVTTQIIRAADKEAGIQQLQQDAQTDLIAIERSHKKSIFKFHGEAELTNIINHIYAPVLIY